MGTEVLNPPSFMEQGRARVAKHLAELSLLLADGRPATPYVATLGETDLAGPHHAVPELTGPVVPVLLHQRAAVVGPVTELPSPRHACFSCLGGRWQNLRSEEERNVLEHGGTMVAVAPSPFLTDLAVEAIGNLAAWVAASPAEHLLHADCGYPYVHELRLDTLQVMRHPLVTDPSCRLCGTTSPNTPEAAVIDLQPRPKRDPNDFRLRSVHEYGLTIEAYANPVCGMIGSAAIPAYDSTTTAPVTGFTRVRGTWMLHEFFWSGHADNYVDSALLGILEGLERYAGLSARGKGEPITATLRSLGGDALDPRDCGVYTDEFYASTTHHYTQFTEDLEVPWVWGYSLRDNRPILVPHRLVYYMGGHHATNFVQECSNGCATGSCLEEAIFYGILELIERDAFLLSWYGKARLPEIDPSTIKSPATRQMISRMDLIGYQVRLFDSRIDLPIPVVTGVAVRKDGGIGTLCFAAGSSPDPEDAVRAALCEIASYVPSFDRRTSEELESVKGFMSDYNNVTELKHHALLFGHPDMAHHADFLLADPEPRSMDELYGDWERTRPRHTDLSDDVRWFVDTLAAAGHDVIAVDQTSPEQLDVGLRTACVIVPGLIPIDFGWQRQRILHMPRLRQAFRRGGWRDTELDVSDINFVPHPFP